MFILAEIEPVWYNCCINSCMAFTGEETNLEECRYCSELQFDAQRKPRRQFAYLPLVPRLKGFFASTRMAALMSYRAKYPISAMSISDVFDSVGYRELLDRQVVVDGETLSHYYFSEKHDIAFSFFTDGYLVFRKNRHGPSATPLVLKNLNLPPDIRTHSNFLIPLGLIPGNPKDMASYLYPFEDELVHLAHGVQVYSAADDGMITLHAYNILNEGDIRAIEKLLNINGVNSFAGACRSCEIQGIRDDRCRTNHYYYPLADPELDDDGNIVREWPAFNLPLRSHESFAEVVQQISEAHTKKEAKDIKFSSGIKGTPVLSRITC